MARTPLTTTPFVANGSITDPAGVATGVGDSNGLVIAAPVFVERIHLRVQNTGGASATVSVKAGTQPTAIASGQGDLVVNVGAGATAWFGPFESARFQQSDGSLAIDSSAAVTVTAFQGARV